MGVKMPSLLALFFCYSCLLGGPVLVLGQHQDPGKMREHLDVLNLVAPAQATHTAAASGLWTASATWGGPVPGAGSRVYIPQGRQVTYDSTSQAALKTVFVEGTLTWATASSTSLVCDTFVNGPGGTVHIGTESAPISPAAKVDIVFTKGAIDVVWDPSLLSRGFVSHGTLRVHGAFKTPHLKVSADPLIGDTSLTLASSPVNWGVGDEIVIAGTIYDGYKWNNTARRTDPYPPQDEVVTISAVSGSTVTFSPPLVHNHTTPRADLKTSIGLLTRNIVFRSEDPGAPVSQRGHVMFMHSRDVDVRYAEFSDLGRTDKSTLARDTNRTFPITPTSNVKGRYSFHFHRNGIPAMEDQRSPAIAIGNSARRSPGWCFVHHDSHALFDSNVAYDCFGASFSAETGNEVGSWTRNLAVYSKGVGWGDPKNMVSLPEFDTGNSGDCFWFQSRMVRAAENVAASCDNAYSYFHRGAVDRSDGASQLSYNARAFQLPDALGLRTRVAPDDAPIRQFVDNEAFASRTGLHVVKANPHQNHDVHSHLKRLTAWHVRQCASITYTAHYIVEDFDCIGRPSGVYTGAQFGIEIANNAGDIVLLRPKIDAFPTGIVINAPDEGYWYRNYVIVNPVFSQVATEYQGLNFTDTLLTNFVITPTLQMTFDQGAYFTYKEGGNPSLEPTIRRVNVTGSKTDSLATLSIPPIGDTGPDNYNGAQSEVIQRLDSAGYFLDTNTGNKVFAWPDFYTDRGTGEVHMLGRWVIINPNVGLHSRFNSYTNVVFGGNITLPNAGPTVTGESAKTGAETDVTINVLANDVDPEGDTLSVAAILQPDRGDVFANNDGTVLFRPDLGYNGIQWFEYWVTDARANYVKGKVCVEIGTVTGSSCPGTPQGTTTGVVAATGGDSTVSAASQSSASLSVLFVLAVSFILFVAL
jgi:Bacterial Ig domain/G8 domain